jgi:hypothetical protein
VRCRACAADRSTLNKAWRAAHSADVEAYNASRRAEYAARHSVARARARLRYALKIRGRVAEATRDLEQAMAA